MNNDWLADDGVSVWVDGIGWVDAENFFAENAKMVFPSDVNYATGESATAEPIEVRDIQ